jgi:hypothetical protein
MRLVRLVLAVAAAATCVGAAADPVATSLFYTTFAGGTNVWRAAFSYDGSGLPAGVSYVSAPIAAVSGADGIVFNPNNGHLLVGGQGPVIHDLPTSGAPVVNQLTPGVNVFHLAVDPTRSFVFGSGIPGNVAQVGIGAGGFTGSFTPLSVVGSTTALTSLAWNAAGTQAFYTNASPSGSGQFGLATIGAASITTTVQQTLLAAHGMIFDPYTGWLTLFGDTQIAQIDPSNPGVLVASRSLGNADFDQGTSDGLGHLWVASNNGNVTFFDLTSCTGGRVDSANCFIDTRFLAANLDDLAPLAGPGGCAPNCNNVPEPTPAALLACALAAMALAMRRRRRF